MQQPNLPSPPHMTTPPKKSSGLKFGVLALGGWLLLIVLFLAIWQFLSPTERTIPVAYTTFLDDVHAGRVEETRVRGREIDYRLAAPEGSAPGAKPPSVTRHTTGPVPDQAFLDTLRPTDPSRAASKVTFEK